MVMSVPWHLYGHIGLEDNLMGSVSPAMWVLAIELRSSHLEANNSAELSQPRTVYFLFPLLSIILDPD